MHADAPWYPPRVERLPTLEAKRVRLRFMTEADAPRVLALFGDPAVVEMMGIERRRDEAHAAALIADIADHARTGDLFQWGIARRDDDAVVGTVTFASIDRRNRRAELGFAVATAFQGQGYATEALRAALDHAFGDMDLHRMEADVDPGNEPSLAVLAKLGFVREGYMQQRWWINGAWADTVFLGLLADAYEALDARA